MMGMLIENRFPYVHGLKSLGGAYTEEGYLYSKKYRAQIDEEYDKIMRIFGIRHELGGNKKIHRINEKEK
jgi:hypothetical protein